VYDYSLSLKNWQHRTVVTAHRHKDYGFISTAAVERQPFWKCLWELWLNVNFWGTQHRQE